MPFPTDIEKKCEKYGERRVKRQIVQKIYQHNKYITKP